MVTSASKIAKNTKKGGVEDGGWKHISAYIGLMLLNLQQPTRLLIVSKGGCQPVAPIPELALQQLEQLLELVRCRCSTATHAPGIALAWLNTLEKVTTMRPMHEAAQQKYEEGGIKPP